MAWVEPLDLQTWFANTLSGDINYFIVLSFIAIISLCAYFRMQVFLVIGFLMLFIITILPLGGWSWLILLIFIAGLFIWTLMGRPFRGT